MSTRRSASVGALPMERKHFVSRNESTGNVLLDVRCACQYFQSDSLMPERKQPGEMRSISKAGIRHQPECSEYQSSQADDYGESISKEIPQIHNVPAQADVSKQTTTGDLDASINISKGIPSDLERTARSRGLVVRSISDADEPSGKRSRFSSVDRLSNLNIGRNPETVSLRSEISLRRISRSPTKSDLFVAELNIGTPQKTREQRSVSASRRSSNIDLSHFSSYQHMPQVSQFAPPPTAAFTKKRSSFIRTSSEEPYTSPPLSIGSDSVEPIANKENVVPSMEISTEIPPQNRPIDISQYENTIELDAKNVDENNRRIDDIAAPVTSSMVETENQIDTVDAVTANQTNTNDNQLDIKLKRAHSPEEETSSVNKKVSYTSKLKSIFSSKSQDAKKEPALEINKYESSPSNLITSVPKEIATHAITSKPEKEATSIQVGETFSLKVDEMDQYMIKPKKPTTPRHATPSEPKSLSSQEDFPVFALERSFTDIREPFAPVIISRNANNSSAPVLDNLLMNENITGNANRNDDIEIRTKSKTPSWHAHSESGGRPLYSASILIGSSDSDRLTRSSSSDRYKFGHQVRSLSARRTPKPSRQYSGGRTQSEDRNRRHPSQDNFLDNSMTKTVSFTFEGETANSSKFQNLDTLNKQNKDEFLEKTYFARDHEYEPIGMLTDKKDEISGDKTDISASVVSEAPVTFSSNNNNIQSTQEESTEKSTKENIVTNQTIENNAENENKMDTAELSKEVPDAPFRKPKRSLMATAQDQSRKMQIGFKTQAGKLRKKLHPVAKRSPTGTPKLKDRKRFKAPEFSNIKIPDIKRLNMNKLRDLKRPQFTKFNKPDMSKFKLPEKLPTIKLKKSKTVKESEGTTQDDNVKTAEESSHQKKLFDFTFSTHPITLRRNKKPEVESSFGTTTEVTSVVPSTTTQRSLQSSSSPQGDRGPGPVRSRWADKFSDVSYNDSEGSRYRRYGSEQESFDIESSIDHHIPEDLEDAVSSNEANLGILGGVTDNKQFAEFDEENRAIHEISNLRSKEFKRRPIIHQDSDVRSDDSKEALGWTEKEIEKNKLLRKAEMDVESSYLNYHPEDAVTQETQSSASSSKKVVLEEIDDDEFFIRKRGISEDNLEIRQYISKAIRERYDEPVNALDLIGQSPVDKNYNLPPIKPRRHRKSGTTKSVSQEFDIQGSEFGDDTSFSHNRSDYLETPRPPARKVKSRRNRSLESRENLSADEHSSHVIHFDNDEEYLRPQVPKYKESNKQSDEFNDSEKENVLIPSDADHADNLSQPHLPRRQKRDIETLKDSDSFIDALAGRSVSNTLLQPTDDAILYRNEYDYNEVPLAASEKYSDSIMSYDDRISRGAISLQQNDNMDASQKFLIDMDDNDGYAVVRKDQMLRPTPPTRRKKYHFRSPGERYTTLSNLHTVKNVTQPSLSETADNKLITEATSSAEFTSFHANYNEDGGYEDSNLVERTESLKDLQSGDVILKMKYRPLPPPPRPPREKRLRGDKDSDLSPSSEVQISGEEQLETSSQDQDSRYAEEVEAETQTDPLPDEFVYKEFEITPDMKIIEPRIRTKTLEQILASEVKEDTEISDQLSKGLQRFRDANQRSLSERSRASSQADRSKSLSRPPTPSTIVVELAKAVQKDDDECLVEAALIVRHADHIEDEILPSQDSVKEDSEPRITQIDNGLEVMAKPVDSLHSDTDITSDQETHQTDEEVERTLQRYRDELNEISRQIMESAKSHDLSPTPSKEITKPTSDSDREDVRYDKDIDSNELKGTINEENDMEAETVELVSAPQPPPRRKSTIASEQNILDELSSPTQSNELTPLQSLVKSEEQIPGNLPYHIADLEVEHLKVHALHAGQIMVSKLHGTHISSDELDCQSGNLSVNNIQLPPLLIEDIIERIRKSERTQLLTTETQTSRRSSPEKLPFPISALSEMVPPPKPPRIRDLEAISSKNIETAKESAKFVDEEIQTEQVTGSFVQPPIITPPAFPTAEYLQSLSPLAFYNIYRPEMGATIEEANELYRSSQQQQHHHHHHPHRHYRNRRSASSSEMEDGISGGEEPTTPRHRRYRRTIGTHQHAVAADDDEDSESVRQAARKLITACSLSLAKIISQLADYFKSSAEGQTADQITSTRTKQLPALAVIFIVITFAVLIFLLTGRNVHIHHWDYFNPPGHDGRLT